jgi:hypothetical protein
MCLPAKQQQRQRQVLMCGSLHTQHKQQQQQQQQQQAFIAQCGLQQDQKQL